jgi:glycosyltransferase involved in cell wall biosynthesis
MRPKISLVTPAFNQGAYLEAAMESVLGQGYADLEYVVMDGGSEDGSGEIIRRYEDRLAYWVSEKDGGQYAALNAGFARTSGEVMGWLNSDDKQLPWCLEVVGEIFAEFPEVEWLTTRFPMRWDAAGRAVNCREVAGYAREMIRRGDNLPGGSLAGAWPMQQESTFWRRSLWERAGGRVSTEFGSAGDYELWLRFAQFAEPVAVSVPLGGFRQHGEQQTTRAREEYQRQARRAWEAQGSKMGRGWEGWRRWLRWWAREQNLILPKVWLGRWGLLYPGWVIERTRDNAGWVKRQVWV